MSGRHAVAHLANLAQRWSHLSKIKRTFKKGTLMFKEPSESSLQLSDENIDGPMGLSVLRYKLPTSGVHLSGLLHTLLRFSSTEIRQAFVTTEIKA